MRVLKQKTPIDLGAVLAEYQSENCIAVIR